MALVCIKNYKDMRGSHFVLFRLGVFMEVLCVITKTSQDVIRVVRLERARLLQCFGLTLSKDKHKKY